MEMLGNLIEFHASFFSSISIHEKLNAIKLLCKTCFLCSNQKRERNRKKLTPKWWNARMQIEYIWLYWDSEWKNSALCIEMCFALLGKRAKNTQQQPQSRRSRQMQKLNWRNNTVSKEKRLNNTMVMMMMPILAGVSSKDSIFFLSLAVSVLHFVHVMFHQHIDTYTLDKCWRKWK